MHATEFRTAHSLVTLDERGVATLTITNAGPLNILGTPVIEDLTRTLQGLSMHPTLRALVLRGTGDRALVGGADIKEMNALDAPRARAFITGLRELCEAVRDFPVPVIARMAGWCLGGGLEFAAACDLRIASQDAMFGMPEVRVGIPSVIQAVLLGRLIGEGNTRWLLLTGANIDAARALQWGFLNEVVPLAELDARIEAVLADILACGPQAIRLQKALIRDWEDPRLPEMMDGSVDRFAQAFETDEPQRYMAPFVARKSSKA